jgi:AcrR family transcriptional regulator
MARPPRFRDEDLLEAARAVFLERGIRTTTAEVAERAGVSEGTLFKRFGSKAALLRAAASGCFGEGEAPLPSADIPLNRERFEALLKQLDGNFARHVPMAAMSFTHLTSPEELPEALRGPRPRPLERIAALSTYFAAQVASGHLAATTDTDVLARVISGALWQHRFFRFVFDPAQITPFPVPRFLGSLADQLWPGIAPQVPPSPKRRPAVKKSPQ